MIDNEFHIIRPAGKVTEVAVGVWAYPESVRLEIGSSNIDLTLDEARKLSASLSDASDLADSIVWDENAPDNDPEIRFAKVEV